MFDRIMGDEPLREIPQLKVGAPHRKPRKQELLFKTIFCEQRAVFILLAN